MKNEGLAAESILEMPENLAKSCQLSGHSQCSHPWIGVDDREANGRQPLISRACFVLVLFLSLPAVLCAQKQQAQWSDLRGLKVGQSIEVIESTMKHHGGEFVSVNEEAVTLQERGSDISIKRGDVVRVSTGSGARRGEHAVVGLLVGGAVGAAIGAASGSHNGFLGGSSRGIYALVGVAIGVPAGATVGVCIPAHTTIYRAARPASAHEKNVD